MIPHDVRWTPVVNMLTVECCNSLFNWPTNISVVECPWCHRKELWHPVYPAEGEWAYPVMENRACR